MDKWVHLPNAVHIDRVLTSVESNIVDYTIMHPEMLRAAHTYYRARSAAHDLLYVKPGLWTSWLGIMSTTDHLEWNYIKSSILSLVVYDDSAHLLDSTPEEIRLLDALGHPYAVLMLPATIALNSIPKTV